MPATSQNLSDADLKDRAALFVRLIMTQPPDSAITRSLHAKLCEIKLAILAGSHAQQGDHR